MNIISREGDRPRDPERLQEVSVQVRVEQDGDFVFRQISILAINDYMNSLSTPPPKQGMFRTYIPTTPDRVSPQTAFANRQDI